MLRVVSHRSDCPLEVVEAAREALTSRGLTHEVRPALPGTTEATWPICLIESGGINPPTFCAGIDDIRHRINRL